MQDDTPIYKNVRFWIFPALTLGLMPFFPEPHIWGKLKWIMGGGAFSGEQPMGFMDWFDVVLHGTPWVMLFVAIVFSTYDLLKNNES